MPKAEYSPQVNEICRLSRTTKMSGVMISASDIRIDGIFEGQIITKGKLVIGENALVTGTIVCQSVDLWGEMKGDMLIEEHTVLKSNAIFNGTLKTSKICIDMGAVFNGPCNILTTEEFNKLAKEFAPEEEGEKEE